MTGGLGTVRDPELAWGTPQGITPGAGAQNFSRDAWGLEETKRGALDLVAELGGQTMGLRV